MSGKSPNIEDFISGAGARESDIAKSQYPWETLDPNEKRNAKNPKSLTLNSYERCVLEEGARKAGLPVITFIRLHAMQKSKELLKID